jgi:hypothetical protein
MPNKHLRALRIIAIRAGAYATCEKGKCPECDVLHEIKDTALKALGFGDGNLTKRAADGYHWCENCGEFTKDDDYMFCGKCGSRR